MTAKDRIAELVRTHLAHNSRFDGVRFIDDILVLAAQAGEIKCESAGSEQLRFDVGDCRGVEVELARAKAKLRLLCARLAVLCEETGTLNGTLYGGEGTISRFCGEASCPEKWLVHIENTVSEQRFAIAPVRETTVPAAGGGAVTGARLPVDSCKQDSPHPQPR